MNKNNTEYWYIFNDRETADIIAMTTGERYKKFKRSDETIVYSFKKTNSVLVSYNSIKEVKKSILKNIKGGILK